MQNSCIKCGKTLTDPVSIKRNMGPTCWGSDIHAKGPDVKDSEHMSFLDVPMSEGIILMRRENGVSTNVPWVVIEGSPDGYEWGYNGSGPNDLSLNIIENILRGMQYRGQRSKAHKGTAYSLSHFLRVSFTREFVGKMPEEGGFIDYKTAKRWVLNRLFESEREGNE